jgi:hypothetical protein
LIIKDGLLSAVERSGSDVEASSWMSWEARRFGGVYAFWSFLDVDCNRGGLNEEEEEPSALSPNL